MRLECIYSEHDDSAEPYGVIADIYDQMMDSSPFYRNIRNAERRLLETVLCHARPRNLIDIGCGTGFACTYAGRFGVAAIGVDPSAAMLEVAKARATANSVNAQFLQGTAERLPEGIGTADLVVAYGSVLNHVNDWDAFFASLSQASHSGTHVLLTVDNVLGLDSWTWAFYRLFQGRADGLRDVGRRVRAKLHGGRHLNSWPLVGASARADVHLQYRSLDEVLTRLSQIGFSVRSVEGTNLLAALSRRTVLSSSDMRGMPSSLLGRLFARADQILGQMLWRLAGTAVLWCARTESASAAQGQALGDEPVRPRF